MAQENVPSASKREYAVWSAIAISATLPLLAGLYLIIDAVIATTIRGQNGAYADMAGLVGIPLMFMGFVLAVILFTMTLALSKRKVKVAIGMKITSWILLIVAGLPAAFLAVMVVLSVITLLTG